MTLLNGHQPVKTLTAERLRSLLDYDSATGLFFWKVKRKQMEPGYIAGSKKADDGYIQISIDGIAYYAHCLAWMHVYGYYPEHEVDHRNLVNDDNRWGNLRPATKAQNSQNRGARSDNKLGVKGVHQRENGKYRASIRVSGKSVSLGTYATVTEAAAAYAESVKEHHGEFGRFA